MVALMVYDQLFETYTHVHLGIALTQDLACVLSTSQTNRVETRWDRSLGPRCLHVVAAAAGTSAESELDLPRVYLNTATPGRTPRPSSTARTSLCTHQRRATASDHPQRTTTDISTADIIAGVMECAGCPLNCSDGGTCNLDTGRCDCPPFPNGQPDNPCARPAHLSHCEYRPGFFVPCGTSTSPPRISSTQLRASGRAVHTLQFIHYARTSHQRVVPKSELCSASLTELPERSVSLVEATGVSHRQLD